MSTNSERLPGEKWGKKKEQVGSDAAREPAAARKVEKNKNLPSSSSAWGPREGREEKEDRSLLISSNQSRWRVKKRAGDVL